MTSHSAHRSLRVLAPSGVHPDDRLRSSAGPLPKRTKRSNACTACKARKSKCSGGQPCNKCNEIGTECIFDRGLDRRRKFAQRHAEQELSSLHQLLDDIVDAFDAGNIVQLGELLSSVRTRSRQAESQDLSFPSDEQSGQSATGADFKEVIEVWHLSSGALR
ncbi:Zn(II)2Cys6 transcription factor domain-containing protein [Aspergillus puulaauensis]|uniref:Zn(2)-C6 fungal-type domain-containing protein n=1 Tax=Aspergillus puulaauensis TaxID=1220207 RepID=A0A7R7XHL9_9EURO|nr:uncharacterized protein APUU_21914S [Aspergillus puulaauensis]BCS21482.1 hypothetical protein APUU_21914S [Aspergillus puulaauensis]